MNRTKLIVVEGLPGSGKTSTAAYIKQLFDEQHTSNDLFLEGDLNHPADYESVACIPRDEYDNWINNAGKQKSVIEACCQVEQQRVFIYYGKLIEQRLPDEYMDYMDEIRKYDIYNLPLGDYQELVLERWQSFVDQAMGKEEVFILECCFIQNPVTMMFGRFGQSMEQMLAFIKKIEQIIQPLNAKIVYFYQDDLKTSLNRIIEERSAEWLAFMTWYYTKQGYGLAHGLAGLEGLIECLQTRKSYELEMIENLAVNKLVINNTAFNWDAIRMDIQKFLI